MRFDVNIYIDSPPSFLSSVCIEYACVCVSQFGSEPTILPCLAKGSPIVRRQREKYTCIAADDVAIASYDGTIVLVGEKGKLHAV